MEGARPKGQKSVFCVHGPVHPVVEVVVAVADCEKAFCRSRPLRRKRRPLSVTLCHDRELNVAVHGFGRRARRFSSHYHVATNSDWIRQVLAGSVSVAPQAFWRTGFTRGTGRRRSGAGHLPPVGTRNPWVLGPSEPTPEEPRRWGGVQGGSGSSPPSWIPNRGVQVQMILRCGTPSGGGAVSMMMEQVVTQLRRKLFTLRVHVAAESGLADAFEGVHWS